VNLLRSEWIKLLSIRTTWTMIGIGLLCEALFAGLFVGLASLSDIGNIEDLITGTGLLMVMMLVLGALIITNEFRHGTASSTFLVTPRRWPALAAKLAAAVLIGVLAGLLFVAVNGGLALTLYSGRGGTLPPAGDLAQVYAGVVISFALLCVFGLGVGAIVRNQVGAIVTAIAFFFVLSALPELLPGSIGEFFPGQAVGTLHGHVEGDGNLTQVEGGLVLAAWATALLAIGTVLVCRRDVSD
jgi:ABC-type transport system involved in multi-copper enzyme maturation permease subunit